MKTAESYVVQYKEVFDQDGKPFKVVRWPPTEKMKTIPWARTMDKGTLKDFQYWVYDPKSSSAVIVCKNNEFRIFDVKDLMSLHS